MKIAILTSLLYQETQEIQGKDRIIWGGAERYLFELTKMLNGDGHQVDIYQSLAGSKPGEPGKYNGGHIVKYFAGSLVTCLANTDDWAISTNHYLNMVFNEIARGYDLAIYFATFLCYPYVLPNSISISHGIFWDYPHHYVGHADKSQKEEFFRRQLYGFTAPALCVAVDSNVKKVIAALDPGSETNVMTIYNFVDTKTFTPVEKDWDDIRVLYPRRLTMLRGCNDFIRASQELKDYKFLAVGQAGNQSLESQAKTWSQGSNIKFVHYEMKDMEKTYQNSDISVVPTTACEGLSLSLLESMSCGLPVITTPVGGLGDAVIPGYNAMLYDHNRGGLTECIDELAKDEPKRKLFGKRNREIAIESFDIEIWKNQWRHVISGFGGGR